MKPSILHKIEHLGERYQEVGALLGEADIIANQPKFRALSQEYAELEPIAQAWNAYRQLVADIDGARELLRDPDLKEMAEEDIAEGEARRDALELELQRLLLPKDPNDGRYVFLEIRAGIGGDEAAIFAGDLFRMYSKYAERKRWKVEIISESQGEHGGFKEIITRVEGQNVYSRLKFESGAHRVQRVPATESQGRIHTSACTVAVMAEPDELDEISLNKADLRIDTFRASGAGGQHVNKTDSAIRITHLPTGIVVECQDERSQHKNRARAMALLQARLQTARQDAAAKEQSETRKSLVGSGDRSERIRTYNYPQGRVTDHRINLTLYKLDEILEGNLDDVIGPLSHEYQAEQLASLAE